MDHGRDETVREQTCHAKAQPAADRGPGAGDLLQIGNLGFGSRRSHAAPRHAKLALAELRIGHEELAAFQGRAAGRVAVGALPIASTVLVPQALSGLFLAQPGPAAIVADGT